MSASQRKCKLEASNASGNGNVLRTWKMHVACKIPSCILDVDSEIHIMQNWAIRKQRVKVKPFISS
jgi:hypothetical protein